MRENGFDNGSAKRSAWIMKKGVVIKLDPDRRRQDLMRIARKRAQSLIEGSAGKKRVSGTLLRMHPGGGVLVHASPRGIQLGIKKQLPRKRI